RLPEPGLRCKPHATFGGGQNFAPEARRRLKQTKAQRGQLREFSSVRWLNVGEVHNAPRVDHPENLRRFMICSRCNCMLTRGEDGRGLLFVERSNPSNVISRFRD